MISNKNDKCSFHSLLLLKIVVAILAFFTLFLDGNSSIANERTSAEEPLPEPPRYRVFNLKHISAEQTKKYLDLTGVNVEVQILREDMFSITGLRPELAKASQVIKLVDAESKFIIKSISIPSDFNDVPTNEEIASQIGGILIGSFSEPPAGVGPKAIIDRLEEKLVIIAPAGRFSLIEKIITEAVRPAQKSQTDANLPADTNQPAMPEQRTYVDANEMKKPDSNDLKIPDINDLTKITDANKIERIDANELPELDVNESSLVEVLDRLVTSLGETKIPETRLPADLQQQTSIATEVNEPNKTAVEGKEQIIQMLEKPQQPEKTAAAVEQKIPDLNEPQLLDTEQIAKVPSYRPEPVIDSNEQLTIEVPEKLKIVDLLGLAGEYLNINYMYDPTQVQGEITLKLRGKNRGQIQVKELYPLVESVLKYKGLVMTRTENNLVIIAPKAQAKDIDPAIIEAEKGQVRIGDVIVTRIFELNYIDAESAKNLLVSMNLGEDINTSASKAGFLIVTGYAHRMHRIEQLLSLVDVPGPLKEFRFRQLKYTMAATLKDKIKTLADQLGTVSITVGATAAPPTEPSQRRRGESAAAYRARQAREARARRTTTTPATTTAAEPESVFLDVDERTNRILMIGLPEQLDTVEGLIDTLDVQQQDVRSLRLYEIQNVDAAEVTGKLQELGIISSTPTAGRARTTARTQRTTTTGRTAAERTPPAGTPPGGRITAEVSGVPSEQEPLIEEPQVVIIESTNSLLVNATTEQHAQIAMIIGFVDAQPEEAAINYVVYPLENQDPEELAAILNQLIQETIERKDPTGRVVGTETTRKIEEDITILADKNTFSIIVYASKRNQQWIETLIRQLDKRRPQVLIDVTLVEISKNDEFNLDLDLLTKYPSLSAVGDLGTLSFLKTLPSLSDPNARNIRIWEAGSTHGAGGKAFYTDDHVQSLLTAVQKKGYGRVLARPKLLVNDNEVGTIITKEVQTVITPTTQVVTGSSGTATASTSVDKSEYTAEISLDITPHISEGDLLRLEINMTRTDFRARNDYSITVEDKALSGPTPPDLLTSNVQTVITVPDKSTIILGGLERLNQTKGGTKVPILGDIPLIGGLFRNTANTDSQSRLYVFVKANILRPSEKLTGSSDIELVSQKNREKFEKYEAQMQEYEDWPGIKPKPMEPVKILEED
jgi:general secretion pathway protein D